MSVKYSNNASTLLSVKTNVGDTVFIVDSVDNFPVLLTEEWMYVSIENEVVKVHQTNGHTYACAALKSPHAVGSLVEVRTTKELLNDIQDVTVLDTGGDRPSPGSVREGEIYSNIPDLQLGIGTSSGNPSDLIALRFHSSQGSYLAGDLVLYNQEVWKALLDNQGAFSTSNWQKFSGGDIPVVNYGVMNGILQVDVSSGEVFKVTVDAPLNISFYGFTADVSKTVMLVIENGSDFITWGGEVEWPDGQAPGLSATGRDRLVFISEDGGTTVDGGLCGLTYA